MSIRLLVLSNPNSIHTIKWITALAKNNFKIVLVGLNTLKVTDYNKYSNIKVITFNNDIIKYENIFRKLRYIKLLPKIKKIISEFKPDILHAHYASSYGLLGALSNFHPFVISVWGSDIYDFPRKSWFHKKILQYNLIQADHILSTSKVLAKETKLYTNMPIEITPFGIDIDIFKKKNTKSLFGDDDIVIGTIKSLEEIYGIENLIHLFNLLVEKYPELPLKLLIVGGGSLSSSLKALVVDLKLEDKTIFTGEIIASDIPQYHNMLSIYVALSKQESFGVAILEASSCSRPVIVSDVGGLPEIVEDKVTGYVVDGENIEKVLIVIEKILFNKQLEIKMGEAGRNRVERLYNWKNNVQQMIDIYKQIQNKH